MFLSIFLPCVLVLLGYLLYFKSNKGKGNFLPGPTPLPLVGNLLSIGFRPYLTFTKWAKRYGPLYRIKMGLTDAVIVNNYPLINELFNNSASTGRMVDNPTLSAITKGPFGSGNTIGKPWYDQRKFTMQTHRTFSLINASKEDMMLDELRVLTDWIKTKENISIPTSHLFSAAIVNYFWRIITGERCPLKEGRAALIDAMDDFNRALLNVTAKGLFFAPFLRIIAPNLCGWNRYVASIDVVWQLLKDPVNEHKKDFDPSKIRDYIDHFLLKIQNETDPESSFYGKLGYENMMANLVELLAGGYESTSAALVWPLLYLSEYQKVQNNLVKEIDEIVGSSLPSLSNRQDMPYTRAVLSEIHRITSVGNLGLPHIMISDLEFQGYHIPKGTTVFANLYGVHHDPEVWGDPECFRPERFLNEDGTQFVHNENLIPFSAGKRRCNGEILATDMIFLFVTGLCQQFHILPDPENKGKADFQAELGMVSGPKPFKVRFISRKN